MGLEIQHRPTAYPQMTFYFKDIKLSTILPVKCENMPLMHVDGGH